MKTSHWLCDIGDTVDAQHFSPPTADITRPVLSVTAFHPSYGATSLYEGRQYHGHQFRRVAAGAVWARAT